MALDNSIFGTEKVGKLLLKLAPPVMLAQLIQALYNIVDSYFVGKYSASGLAALSVIFPLQLLISALAIGTGVGVNTLMSHYYGISKGEKAFSVAGTEQFLAVATWIALAAVAFVIMPFYAKVSLVDPESRRFACEYGRIVCVGSIGIFLESNWSKVLQAKGDMRTPMAAQIAGALINILFDWLLIFGVGPFPRLGIAGAAAATVGGQIAAAVIVGIKAMQKMPGFKTMRKFFAPIYKAGVPNILMNALCTVYIIVLNLILVRFSDDAVTVLGLYYKLQTFLLIPLMGLNTCIVPVLSYNFAAGSTSRCKSVLWYTVWICAVCMAVGTAVFEIFPRPLLAIFASGEPQILDMGTVALRIIAASFTPFALSLVMPAYFQAIGLGVQSVAITVLRQILLLMPLAYVLSFFGLTYVWFAFPITEFTTAAAAFLLYKKYPPEKYISSAGKEGKI